MSEHRLKGGASTIMSARSEFDELLKRHLVPEFCSDLKRSLTTSGYLNETNFVTERDAVDFLRAWKAGLAVHRSGGRYHVCEAQVVEQFFWERGKAVPGRKFSLWMEPVITLGAFARLHLDLGWPKTLLVSQPGNWAIDLAAVNPAGEMVIAGEVKKTRKETEAMITHMRTFGELPNHAEPLSGPARNAFRKVLALRKNAFVKGLPLLITWGGFLWARAHHGYEQVFSIKYDRGPRLRFVEAGKEALRYRCG